jgi:hypothetical protein
MENTDTSALAAQISNLAHIMSTLEKATTRLSIVLEEISKKLSDQQTAHLSQQPGRPEDDPRRQSE